MPRKPFCAGVWAFKSTALAALFLAGAAAADPVEITAQSEVGVLTGTLEQSAPVTAAALILPGSGPTDRDGNTAVAGVTAAPYLMLSRALADQGIATARVDKRGVGGSTGTGTDPLLSAYVGDTRAWVDVVRKATGASCVWLIGHSEGALISMLTAAEDPEVCGMVLLTSPGRVIADIFFEQVATQPQIAPYLGAFTSAIETLVAGGVPDVSGLPASLQPMFHESVRDYMRDFVATDPAALIAATDVPTLILHGDGDIQTPPTEAAPLMAARPDATARVLPGMTHMLKPALTLAEAGGVDAFVQASLATYSNPTLPLHADLVPLIVDFIAGHP
jgi:hypothetical protein